MNLLIDIGNTRIKWVLAEHTFVDSQVAHGHVTGDFDGLIDQLVRDVDARLAADDRRLATVWVASVGDVGFVQALGARAQDHWGAKFEAVSVTADSHGVRNSYEQPGQMGVDRWVALIAARHHVPDNAVVVVDAGTAITVDTLDRTGVFVGGLILPGAALARRSLLANTDRIHESEEDSEAELSPFGVNTGQCVHRGSRFAAIGGVRLAIERVTNALGEMPEVILCGGGADTIYEHLGCDVIHKPWLVLEGLALLANETSTRQS